MSNEDTPENADKEPKSMQGSSEEQPPEPREDATRPNPALEPTEQDEPEEAARRDAPLDADAHSSHHGHGLAHTMPVWMLVAVLGALMGLTVLTVSVTSFDLGSQGNLVVAMVIATIKAALVITFFMHLLWDKKFHLILFVTAV
ncbi:MAG TPA: cytochrome C oxidase subunit IV family protein, partial [Polyangiaceae bacterium]|nr:cytochrome C oxidase subunit IV family protein [Polyangiaceae bacterium]